MRLDRKQALIGFGLAFAVSVFGHTQAQATPYRHSKHRHSVSVPHKHHHRHHHHRHVIDGNRAGIIGGRPAGCPTQFCGCAVAQALGLNDRSLWLARSWYRFPRTSPHPGAVAVRAHHVWLLRQHIGGDVWLGYDPNSGGHRTRLHPRSIAGFTIVEPSRRFASAL